MKWLDAIWLAIIEKDKFLPAHYIISLVLLMYVALVLPLHLASIVVFFIGIGYETYQWVSKNNNIKNCFLDIIFNLAGIFTFVLYKGLEIQNAIN